MSKDLTAFAGYSLLYFYKMSQGTNGHKIHACMHFYAYGAVRLICRVTHTIMLELLDAMRIVSGFSLPRLR